MKRFFDCILCLVALNILMLPIMLVALSVRVTSTGPVLYWSERVGRRNVIFRMPKFLSMRIDTPAVHTHFLQSLDQQLIPIGLFLRKNSLDELQQLWNILKGELCRVAASPLQPGLSDRFAYLKLGFTNWCRDLRIGTD